MVGSRVGSRVVGGGETGFSAGVAEGLCKLW